MAILCFIFRLALLVLICLELSEGLAIVLVLLINRPGGLAEARRLMWGFLAGTRDLGLHKGFRNLAPHEYLLEVGPVLVVQPLGCIYEITQPEVGAAILCRAWANLLVAII